MLGYDEEKDWIAKKYGFKIVTAFDRGRNYMTLGYQGKKTEPASFWAQWTVFEYEKKDVAESHKGKEKVQFAPVFVGDGDFTKMIGWGMELLVFTSYRGGGGGPWFRNIERCKGEVTSLLGKIIDSF